MVKAYEAILGLAAVIAESSVDLPAFGKPTSPTSASSFNSRIYHPSTPSSPGWANRGVCSVGVLKLLLPSPPRPPGHKTRSSPGVTSSKRVSPVSASLTTVPTGTGRMMLAPFFPCLNPPLPLPPSSAMMCLRYLRWMSVQN